MAFEQEGFFIVPHPWDLGFRSHPKDLTNFVDLHVINQGAGTENPTNSDPQGATPVGGNSVKNIEQWILSETQFFDLHLNDNNISHNFRMSTVLQDFVV